MSTAPAPTVSPIVNHGRWIIRCPGCPSALLASRSDHRFFCPECANALDNSVWLPVVWPDDADRIEAVLGARPDRRARNWEPPETLADLVAENIAHGVA